MKGTFITFEGGEGVGKSTQVRMIMEYLERTNQPALLVRQPGGTPICEKIRNIILSPESTAMTKECEAYLYAAARAQLVSEVIKPALEEGKIVICDRHIDSSIAYQGAGRDLGFDNVIKINEFAVQGLNIDATIFIDLPHDKMFRSKTKAQELNDRFEVETSDFHNKVYEGFREIARRFPERVITIIPQEEKTDTSTLIINALKDKGLIK